MRRGVKRYEDVIMAALVAVEVVSAAVYVHAIENSTARRGVSGLLSTLEATGWSNAFVVALFVALVVHGLAVRTARTLRRDDQMFAVGQLLEVAARALVFPESWDAVEVRAFCHRLDRKGKWLQYAVGRSSHAHDDVWDPVPVDELRPDGQPVFVIAEAAKTHNTVLRELSSERSPVEKGLNVWKDIRVVLAAPIRDPDDRVHGRCLGTVSFDTSESGRGILVDNEQRSRDIIAEVARGIAHLWC